MDNLYYKPPSDIIFEEVKQKAIEVWKNYDNEFGYVDEKVDAIKTIQNVGDNFMYIVAMMDLNNQALLAIKLTPAARLAVSERIIAGGAEDIFNMFFE